MTEATRPPSNSLTGDATTNTAASAAAAATTGKNGAIGEFMKCMKRGDVVGVEQLARVSYDRDRMILHRALAHGRPRVRPPKYASLYGSFAPRPPWVPCVRILLNLPGITETFSCLYEGKSITSLAAFHREREAAEVMQLLFKAGADPNGIEGEETHPFIYSQIAGEDMAGLFLSHPKFNWEKADLSKIFAQYCYSVEKIFSNTPINKTLEVLGLILKRLENPDHKDNFKNALVRWATNCGPVAQFILDNSLCTPDQLFSHGLYATNNADAATIALNAGAKVILPQDFSYTNVFRSKNEKLLSLLIDKGFPFPDMGEVACQSTEVWNLFKSRGFEYRPQSASYDRPTVTHIFLRRGDFDEAMRIKGNRHFPLPWARIIRERFPPEQPIDMAEMKRYLDAASSDTDWMDLIKCYIYGSTTEPLRACVARADRSQLSPDLLRELLIGSIEWRLPVPLYFEKINFVKSLGAQIDTEIITACICPSRGEPPPREVIESLINDLFGSLSREQKEGAANKIITYAVARNFMWVVEKVAKLNEGRLPEGILFSAPSDEMFRLLESLGAGLGEDFSLYDFTTKSRELEAAIGKFILEHPDQLEPIPEEFMEACEYDYSPIHLMATQLRLPILKALLATGWNANLRDPDTKETPIRAVLSLPVSENDFRLQREVALELISGGAKVTVDDLSSILIEHKVSEDTNGATPDSIYFAFTRFSQHRIDTLTTVAKVVPPAVLLSSSPPSAESSSPKAATGKRCPNLLWAACLCRNTTVITSVVSLLNSAASSLSGLESVRGREEQTTTTATTRTTAAETTTTKTTTAEEAARKKEQAKVMMGALVGQRREKDGLTVVEFLTKKGCLDCLNALNSALLL